MENTNNIEKTDKKEEASTHKIGIYLWIWTLLFVLSFFSTKKVKRDGSQN